MAEGLFGACSFLLFLSLLSWSDKGWASDEKSSLFPHKRSYFMPLSYVTNPSDIYKEITSFESEKGRFYKNEEAEFQISFLFPLYREIAGAGWDLMAAYTHRSWWQIYNGPWSHPFRETNYAPEVFFRRQPGTPILGLDLAAFDVGYMHQSNGQIQLISRSWDRIFARAVFGMSHTLFTLTSWARLPEKPHEDDNPSIERRLGYGELLLLRCFGSHTLQASFSIAEVPNAEIQYSLPWQGDLRWFMNVSSGYGPSLIEYNKKTRRVGLGITVNSFFDQQAEKLR